MIGASVQLIAGFLAHATFGINALAADLPRTVFAAPGHLGVELDAPPTVPIYNDAQHKGLTLEGGYKPESLPAILVLRETREVDGGPWENPRTPTPRQIGLNIVYATDDKADALTAQAECETLLRAAERSLRRYKNQTNAEGYRELNGIRVMDVTKWKRIEETAALDVVRFWGWLEVELKVVDTIA